MKWQPLADSTVEAKRKNSTKILIDTGQMVNATFARAEGANTIVFGVSGAAASYAVPLQFGAPRNNLPARPFLPLDESGENDFSKGRAKVWMTRVLKSCLHYIKTGELKA
jgi:phage gpG-like protein